MSSELILSKIRESLELVANKKHLTIPVNTVFFVQICNPTGEKYLRILYTVNFQNGDFNKRRSLSECLKCFLFDTDSLSGLKWNSLMYQTSFELYSCKCKTHILTNQLNIFCSFKVRLYLKNGTLLTKLSKWHFVRPLIISTNLTKQGW